MDLATQGMSLGEMAQKMQMGQLQLQQAQQQAALWQDPSMAPVLQSLLGGGGQGGSAPGAQGGSGPQSGDIASLQSKYGLALPGFVNQALTMQKNAADVGKLTSDTTKNYQDITEKRLGVVAHFADNYASTNNPQSYAQMAVNVQGWGLDKYLGSPPDPSQDPQGAQTYATAAQGTLLDPTNRANMAKAIAETGVAQQTVQQGPAKLAIAQQDAAVKAATAGIDISKYMTGEPFQGTDGQIYMKQPATDANGNRTLNVVPAMLGGAGGAGPPNITPPGTPSVPPVPSGTVPPVPGVTDPGIADRQALMDQLQANGSPRSAMGGAPTAPNAVQPLPPGTPGMGPTPPATVGQAAQAVNPSAIGMTTGSKALLDVDAKTAGDLAAKIPSGYAALQNLDNMAQTAASGVGIYSGPIKGSDFFQSVAGVLSQLPGAPDNMAAKVSNTQAWKQQGGEFLLDTMGEMKGFVPRSAAAMNAIRAIKPNEVMTPQAQQMVISFLRDAINTQINYAKAASVQVGANQPIANTPMPSAGPSASKLTMNPDGSWGVDLR
jgi:hypothetical protein